MRARGLAIVAIALLPGPLGPQTAAAVVCGEADPKSGEKVKGSLLLNEKASTTARKFGRGKGTRRFVLVYDVSGCSVAVKPAVSNGPSQDADEEIPTGALATPTIEARGDDVKITYAVRHDQLDPGSYGSLIEVSAPGALTTVRTPITLSRSENRFWVPGVLGLLAGIAGFFILYSTKRLSRHRLIVSPKWFWIAAGTASAAGAYAAIVGWSDQDVWVAANNWKATVATAATQSTAGVMVALLAGLFAANPDPEPDPDPDPDPEPPNPTPPTPPSPAPDRL